MERGTTASFKCLAVGKPVPTIEWFIGTRLVGRGSTLSLANVNTASAAVYTCGASNSAGKTTASARLVVFGKFIFLKKMISLNTMKGCCFFTMNHAYTFVHIIIQFLS